jgi:deoxyribodipyrimidine photolyase-related protein
MLTNFVIFPIHLYYHKSHIDLLKQYNNIYLVEEPRYFTDFKFHKLKLAYHRASMKKYYDYLKKNKINIKYINFDKIDNIFYKNLKDITFIDPIDNNLTNKLLKLVDCNILESIQFLITKKEILELKNLNRNDIFYKYMRKKLDILIHNNKPIGGKWSFDKDNRKSIPKNISIPKLIKFKSNKYISESKDYVTKNFENNYGLLDNFIYPIDYKDTIKWINNFLENKLNNFGPYEDGVLRKDIKFEENNFLFHSVLTPMLNIGLITDYELLDIVKKYYEKNKSKIRLESYEGFIRQLIGWRQYVLSMYILHGDELSKSNILGHNIKIKDKFWNSVNIEPIDDLINKIKEYSYVHHIERLMYLGNFMLLCQIDPKEVYRMFMEWTIDAYDWVMVPNVYGMSQYASDMMMTRPYFSSSNYLLKMSNYKKSEWCKIWDALYYSFIDKHYDLFKNNYATAMQVKHWKNKTNKEKEEILNISKNYIKKNII